MPPANQSARSTRRGRLGWAALGILTLLLITPAFALSRISDGIDWRLVFGGPLVMSIFTFFSYRSDKRRAEAGEWRIPESTLHLAELLGGWPGAFLAQRVFRHKTAKGSFLFVFWAVVLIHEYLAVDTLLQWRLTQQAIQFIKSLTN